MCVDVILALFCIWKFEKGVCSQHLAAAAVTDQNSPVICNSKWLCPPEPKRFISATERFHFCSCLLCPANQTSLPMPVWSSSSLYLLQLQDCSVSSVSPHLLRQRRSQRVAATQNTPAALSWWVLTSYSHSWRRCSRASDSPADGCGGNSSAIESGVESRGFLCHPANWLCVLLSPEEDIVATDPAPILYLLCGVAMVFWKGEN